METPDKVKTRHRIFFPPLLHGALLFVAMILMPFGAEGLTVRVQPVNGVPQILVNGTPTIARVFYGGPGAPTTNLAVGEQRMSMTFTPIESSPDASMHFGFNDAPGHVTLDDIRVVDLTEPHDAVPLSTFDTPDAYARDWKFSPRGNAAAQVVAAAGPGGRAALQIDFTGPATTGRDVEHLQYRPRLKLVFGHTYRVDFWAKSDVVERMSVVFIGGPPHWGMVGAGNEPFYAQIQMAARAQVNFVSFIIYLPWPEPGKPADFSHIDALCNYVLEANPNALIIPRVGIDPPQWWLKAHPDQQMQWQEPVRSSELNPVHPVAIASRLYRQEAAAHLSDLIGHMESAYGDHIAGYHIAAQNTNEWFYNGTWWNAYSGYAPPDLVEWRAWLHTQYASDADLQKAWNDPAVTRDTAEVPPAARRRHVDADLLDPVADRPVLDWNDYRQEDMADAACELAHVARQKTAGRKLVLEFYGYLFEFAGAPGGASVAGHYDLRRLLDSPDLDILCSPISYFDRGAGQGAPAMTAAESVELAGKLYLMEDDTSTYLNYLSPPGANAGASNIGETHQLLLRNGAEIALRNFGTWWMDLCQIGWFDDSRMWAMLDRFRPVETTMLRLAQPFRPEIAAVIDEKNMRMLTSLGAERGRAISESRAALGRVGAPYGQYLNDDVLAARVPWAKMEVFLSPWRMTAHERAQLLDQTRGKVRVWGYAPGYDDGDTASLAAMRQLTGFQVEPAHPVHAVATPTDAGRKLGLAAPFGKGNLRPAFAVTDATADETLATFDDGSAAVALRRTADGGASLFVGTGDFTPELLRIAARVAGVHLYTQANAVIYANGPYVAVAAPKDGPDLASLSLDVGRAGPVTDVMTGEVVGTGPRFDLPIRKGETRVLELSPAVASP
jgi:hypothetical protein